MSPDPKMSPMEKILERIEAKVDRLDARADKQDMTLVRNTVTLEEHVRRTNLLEKNHERIETESKTNYVKLEKEIEPLKKALNMWRGAGKALAILGPVVALAYGIIRLVHLLGK